MILVGYDDQSKAYKCFNYNKCKINISRDIKFQLDEVGILVKQQQPKDDLFIDSNSNSLLLTRKELEESPSNLEKTCFLPNMDHAPTSKDTIPGMNFEPFSIDSNSEPRSSEPFFPIRRSSRFRSQNVCLDDYIFSVDIEDFDSCHATIASNIKDDNISLQKALNHSGWTQTMKEELQSIESNQTWDLIPLSMEK